MRDAVPEVERQGHLSGTANLQVIPKNLARRYKKMNQEAGVVMSMAAFAEILCSIPISHKVVYKHL